MALASGRHTGYKRVRPRTQCGAIVFQPLSNVDSANGIRLMKVREIIRLLEQNGWSLVATRGSHRQYKHQLKSGRVTIAGKLSADIAPGTLNSILKQAGLKERR